VDSGSFAKVSIPGKGGRLWIHTGPGDDSGTHLFWNSRAYIWNKTGDTAELRTPAGALHDT
jgi:hypothetical protein